MNNPKPATNRKKNIVIVANYNQIVEIQSFLSALAEHFAKDEVVVVDDGSSDGSGQLAATMGYRVLFHERNRGIGAAIRTGLAYAMENQFEGVLISSSNGKMIPSEFRRFLDLLDAGVAQYIQGSRFVNRGHFENMPVFRQVMIPILSAFWSAILRTPMTDITCGLRAYKVYLLHDPRIDIFQSWLDKYEMEYYLHIKFLRVLRVRMIEIPVTIRYSHLQKNRLSKIKPLVGWWSMARPFVFLFLGLKK